MRFKQVSQLALATVAGICTLTACSAGSSNPQNNLPATVPATAVTQAPSTSAIPYTYSRSVAKYSLPSLADFSGQIALGPALQSAASTPFTMQGTYLEPADALGTYHGADGSVSYSLDLNFPIAIKLSEIPEFTINIPSKLAQSGREFSYTLYAGPGCTNKIVTVQASGLDGRMLTFPNRPTPLLLGPEIQYRFIFTVGPLPVTAPSPTPSAQPEMLWATSGSSNAVSAFDVQSSGVATPVATVSGPHTQLDGPIDVKIGPHGNIYVLNADDSNHTFGPHGSVTVYPAGSSGDVTPTFTVPSGVITSYDVEQLGVDANGGIYVSSRGVGRETAPCTEVIGGVPQSADSCIGPALNDQRLAFAASPSGQTAFYTDRTPYGGSNISTFFLTADGYNTPDPAHTDFGITYLTFNPVNSHLFAAQNNELTVYDGNNEAAAIPFQTISLGLSASDPLRLMSFDPSGNLFVIHQNNAIGELAAGELPALQGASTAALTPRFRLPAGYAAEGFAVGY